MKNNTHNSGRSMSRPWRCNTFAFIVQPYRIHRFGTFLIWILEPTRASSCTTRVLAIIFSISIHFGDLRFKHRWRLLDSRPIYSSRHRFPPYASIKPQPRARIGGNRIRNFRIFPCYRQSRFFGHDSRNVRGCCVSFTFFAFLNYHQVRRDWIRSLRW